MIQAIDNLLINDIIGQKLANNQPLKIDAFTNIDELVFDAMSVKIMAAYKVSPQCVRSLVDKLRHSQEKRAA